MGRLTDRILTEDNLSSLFVTMARIPYFFLKLLPARNKVVLISRQNSQTSIDFQLLEKEIKRQYPETKVVILNHFMSSKLAHIRDILIEEYHLATSRACIIDSYVIAVSILRHKKELTVVQIWHALGAIKQFGYMTLDKKAGHSSRVAHVMNMHGNYDYICCGGAATIPIYAQTFGADPKIIKPIGMPRVDYLVDAKQTARNQKMLYRKYPQLRNKKVILYAPTFRRNGRISPQALIDHIDLNKYALIIKQHRLDKTKLPAHDSIIQIKDKLDSLQLLSVADYVITDYSAVTFEAAAMNKPLFFWDYDHDKYVADCGLAMDYLHDMPGLISEDPAEIADAIKHRKFSLKRVRDFADKWVTVRDGTCTHQIVQLLGL